MENELTRLLEGRRLSPVQRRIAQYLLRNPQESPFLSSTALAERAGVSQPSVTRFAVALGFAGYPELRTALRPLSRLAGEGRGNGLQDAIDDEIRNLAAIRERLADLSKMKALGGSLAASRPLPVLGLRVSAGLATAFAYFARRIHPDIRLLTGGPLIEELYAAKEAGATWVLAFVLPRYPAAAVQALAWARESGLHTAVITDRRSFPADAVLEAGVSERLVFDSHAAPLAMSMTVVQAMADADAERTQRRLEDYERLTEETRVFYDQY